MIGICLDCFVEKRADGNDYHRPLRRKQSAKRRDLLLFRYEGRNGTGLRRRSDFRIDQGAFSIALEDIKDV